MAQRIPKLKYWCVHDMKTPKKLLFVADRELYDRQPEIEKELSGVCAASFAQIPVKTPEEFEKKLKLLCKEDGSEYDAVFFRALKPDDGTYSECLESLVRMFPESKVIAGLFGDEDTDKKVKKAADILGIDAASEEKTKNVIASLPEREKDPSGDVSEAIGWIIYEQRSKDEDLPRILLIGDSIVWGAHEAFFEAVKENYSVTTFVSSMGVNEKRFFDTVSGLCGIDGLRFDAAFFNNGLHTHSQTVEEYAENLKNTLKKLIERFPEAKWMIGTSTKISVNPNSPETTDTPITELRREENETKNALMLAYNEEVKKAASELGVELFDSYTLLEDKDSWKIDPYHYNGEGRKVLGEALAKALTATKKNI
ncbi:MAG: SGNH/GDSL hydrolase family protein [Clostridia bacterium]|nr:SGNH/GDSL hydrolase family protein [Clostridia bacterium]